MFGLFLLDLYIFNMPKQVNVAIHIFLEYEDFCTGMDGYRALGNSEKYVKLAQNASSHLNTHF